MKIISIASSKGGVGKSTVTLILALSLASDGKKVLIADIDHQRSLEALNNVNKANEIDVIGLEAEKALKYIRENRNYDYILFDIARISSYSDADSTIKILNYCDHVIIPVQAAFIDAISTLDFVDVLKKVSEYRKTIDLDFSFYGFINKSSRRKYPTKDILKAKGLKMLDSELKDLKQFTEVGFHTDISKLDSSWNKLYTEIKTKINVI